MTFDSGGVSIKPSANMSEMKADMTGGACVAQVLMKKLLRFSLLFKNKRLCDNPARFYRLSEGDIAAARKAKGN